MGNIISRVKRNLRYENPVNKPPKDDLINQLSPEIIKEIFSYLGRDDLRRCQKVCNTWKEIASDMILRLETFGKKEWMTYFGNPGEVPPIPENISLVIDKLSKSTKKSRDFFKLVLIPKTVDGEPYCLNLLFEKLINHPEIKEKLEKEPIYDHRIKAKFGVKSVKESYWALISKDVLIETRGKGRSVQKETANNIEDCRLPKLIEASTSIIAHYVQTGKRLYHIKSKSLATCKEKIKYHFLIECITHQIDKITSTTTYCGFNINDIFLVSFQDEYYRDSSNLGTALVSQHFH